MKRLIPGLISGLLVFFISGCTEPEIIPADNDLQLLAATPAPHSNGKNNKLTLALTFDTGKAQKIEINRNQATLNFDDHEPRIASIKGIEKMTNLKNFRAANNALRDISDAIFKSDVKRIEVSNNLIRRLPLAKKGNSLKLLDLSFNKIKISKGELRRLVLPDGAVLNISSTGIPCSEVCDYIKRFPEVTVITECDCNKKTE